MLNSYDDYYDIISDGYDRLYGDEQLKKLHAIESAIKTHHELHDFISPKYALLDIGCGTGISTDYFPAKEKLGIDPSQALIKIASEKHPHCKFILSNAEDIAFKGKEFDIIISLTAIQNFRNIENALKNIRSAGKRFILTFLKRTEKREIIEQLIKTNFEIIKTLEEEKDLIYFCK